MNEYHGLGNSESSVRGCFRSIEDKAHEEPDKNFRRGSVSSDNPECYMPFKPRKHTVDEYLLNIIGCQGEDGITKTELRKESGKSWQKMEEGLAVLVDKGFVVVESREGATGRTANYYIDSFYRK